MKRKKGIWNNYEGGLRMAVQRWVLFRPVFDTRPIVTFGTDYIHTHDCLDPCRGYGLSLIHICVSHNVTAAISNTSSIAVGNRYFLDFFASAVLAFIIPAPSILGLRRDKLEPASPVMVRAPRLM